MYGANILGSLEIYGMMKCGGCSNNSGAWPPYLKEINSSEKASYLTYMLVSLLVNLVRFTQSRRIQRKLWELNSLTRLAGIIINKFIFTS